MFFERRLLELESETDFVSYLEDSVVQSQFSYLVQECLTSKEKRQEVEREMGSLVMVFEFTRDPLQHAMNPCSIARARLAFGEIIKRLPDGYWPEVRDLAKRLDRVVERTAASRLCWVNIQAQRPLVFAKLGLVDLI